MYLSYQLLILLPLLAVNNSFANELPLNVYNPHALTMSENRPQCIGCHVDETHRADAMNGSKGPTFIDGGINACITCHESAAEKHMVGQRPDFRVPESLPLDEQGRITCLTCHHAHGPLKSEETWVDVSWIDRLTASERLHKTFLLRRNNRQGGLCKACHET